MSFPSAIQSASDVPQTAELALHEIIALKGSGAGQDGVDSMEQIVRTRGAQSNLRRGVFRAKATARATGFEPGELRDAERTMSRTQLVADAVFTPLQKWEGVVLDVLDDSFVARLTDATSREEDNAEILLGDVGAADLELVQPGAIFYWNIGYRDTLAGERSRTSTIRFRRLPRWSEEEIEVASRTADRVRKELGWARKRKM